MRIKCSSADLGYIIPIWSWERFNLFRIKLKKSFWVFLIEIANLIRICVAQPVVERSSVSPAFVRPNLSSAFARNRQTFAIVHNRLCPHSRRFVRPLAKHFLPRESQVSWANEWNDFSMTLSVDWPCRSKKTTARHRKKKIFCHSRAVFVPIAMAVVPMLDAPDKAVQCPIGRRTEAFVAKVRPSHNRMTTNRLIRHNVWLRKEVPALDTIECTLDENTNRKWVRLSPKDLLLAAGWAGVVGLVVLVGRRELFFEYQDFYRSISTLGPFFPGLPPLAVALPGQNLPISIFHSNR